MNEKELLEKAAAQDYSLERAWKLIEEIKAQAGKGVVQETVTKTTKQVFSEAEAIAEKIRSGEYLAIPRASVRVINIKGVAFVVFPRELVR